MDGVPPQRDPLALDKEAMRQLGYRTVDLLVEWLEREELAEWDYGDFEGITTAEIREEIPDWTIWRYGARGGESVAEVQARVDRVVEELRGPDGDVLVFGHGHVLRVLAARWLGLAVADGRLFALDSATLSALGYERDEPVIRVWNAPLA